MKPRLLFIATHPKEAPSTRNRIFAYEPALRQAGFEVDVHTFFPSEALDAINAKHRWSRKTSWVLDGAWRRWRTLRTGRHELIFIHRELFPWGMPVGMAMLMAQLRQRKTGLIYDFDDAVFLPHRQDRPVIGKLEDATSVHKLMAASDAVIAGNTYLAGYARRFNERVACLPTPVDTTRFLPARGTRHGPCVIGWIGSPSTAKYLQSLAPALQRLSRTHPFQLKVIGAGHTFAMPDVPLDLRPWRLEDETNEFSSCDIGLYPLWDDAWSRGKCGFKALQFMASGVPVVASAIGMNTEIIQDRVNGLLVGSHDEWLARLTELLEDAALRRTLGMAGRQTVETRYSLQQLAPRFLATIEETLATVGSRHVSLQRPQPELPCEFRRPQAEDCPSTESGSPHNARIVWGAPSAQADATVSAQQSARPAASVEHPDILCFSSIDWDFIWQGHQEIMSTLAAQGHRVLFIENTGVRNPQLRDLPRIRRRLMKRWRSLEGFHQEQENLYVFSPLVLPFPYLRPARWINRQLLLSGLRRWMQAMEFSRPICWTFLPTPITLEVIRQIPHRALIYYCIDSFSDSTPAARRIIASEQQLLREADAVFVTSRRLYDQAARWNRQVHFFPFGVRFKTFEDCLAADEAPPDELRDVRHPVIGYIGGVHQWVDQDLLCYLARAHPAYQFLLIGPAQTNVDRLRREPNIRLIGQRSHDELPRYLKYFDAGIIPYRVTDYTKNVYPTKLNEYHAMGKPVISTALPEVEAFNRRHGELVRIAATADAFADALTQALRQDTATLRERRIAAARENSWSRRIETMQQLIGEVMTRKASRSRERWTERLKASLRASRTTFHTVLVATVLCGVFFGTPLPWFLARPLMVNQAPAPADAIVVFGGGVGESGQAGESSQERVKYAAELFRQRYAPRLLLVSGYTSTFDETEVMRALSEASGVPPAAILTETHVHHTHDYVLQVRAIGARESWHSVLLVTSPYHTRRAALTFARNIPELRVTYSPVPLNWFYAHRWWGMNARQLRGIAQEYAAIAYYWLRGWI